MDGPEIHDAIAAWLATPAAYPHRPDHVECIETHISRVYLAGEFVFKLKKPVKFDFLDFASVEKREWACREELRLNRRLAPDTYLDVLPITQGGAGAFTIGGAGGALDWVVKMRRLATDQTLEVLYQRGELRTEHIERLAQVLSDFYRKLPALAIASEEYRQRCEAHVRGNQRELLAVRHHLPRGVVERVHAFQLQLLKLRPELLDARALAGRIVDGHGDLRPEHICLTDPPVIFDCIEFSADFRRADVVDELCFLATECDFLGADWVGARLLEHYQVISGDRPPGVLLDFYKSYRACVRAKVAALREDQTTGRIHAAAAAEAARHLELADRYIQPWARPLVLVVGGLSGTGKTTLARGLAEALAAELLRTDEIRRQRFGASSGPLAADEGIYSLEKRQQVYDTLIDRARQLNADGISVVLDGTFSSESQVRAARGVAAQPLCMFLAVECVCSPEVARQRIEGRLIQGDDVSDARPETHELQRVNWRRWPDEIPQVRVNTETTLLKQVEAVIAALARLFKH